MALILCNTRREVSCSCLDGDKFKYQQERMKSLLIFASFILTISPIYPAEVAPPSDRPAPPRRPAPKWIQANDTNKNGKLDPEEIGSIKTNLTAKRIEFKQRHDTDGDGKLSHEELKTMRQTLAAQRAAKERQMREAIIQTPKPPE